jgi:sensor histidine kinase YesM
MHPLLASRTNILAYFLGWLLAGLCCAGLTIAEGADLQYSCIFGALSAVSASVIFLPVYYPCLALKPEKTNPIILLSSLVVVASSFGAIWACAVFSVLRFLRWAGYDSLQMPDFTNLILMGGVICALTEAVYYVYIAHARTREAERVEQELRVMAREAELKALRSQLNPHFLFNSLNSISALTTPDPGRAREMCVLLSDFLRKRLRLGERQSVSLSEELDLVKNYFAIEQIRFAPRLSVEWEIDGDSLQAEIPTLLLQPLVENAVKHGISQLVEGGAVRIKAETQGENVLISLENPIDPDAETPKGLGLGVRQVHQRLSAYFGSGCRMEVNSNNGLHSVKLFFPLLKKETEDD